MATLREMVYMCVDMLKSASDDAYYTEEHIKFLINKFRSLILKRTYLKGNLAIPESNYQTLCIELHRVYAIPALPCEGGEYVKSIEKIPSYMHIGTQKIYAIDYFQGNFEFVPMERFRWAGSDKWRRNLIYATIAPDGYLYLRSRNPQHLYLKDIRFTAVFDDPVSALELSCDSADMCDILDAQYPLEDSLVMQVIEMVVQEIIKQTYTPEMSYNNSSDDQGVLNDVNNGNAQAQQEQQQQANRQQQVGGDE